MASSDPPTHPHRAGLSRIEARWAIRQSGVGEMHTVLAYAEGFSLIAAGLGVASEAPGHLVRRLIDDTVRGTIHWLPIKGTFPTHLCQAARMDLAGRLVLHARMRGREHQAKPWSARLSVVQVGDLRGIEELAHWAGEVMPRVRSNDAATLDEAIKLADFVRKRFEPFVGEPDDEDTARLSPPAAPGESPGPGGPEGGKTN